MNIGPNCCLIRRAAAAVALVAGMFVPLGCGSGPEEEMPLTGDDAAAEDPMACSLTETGYVNTFFGFGVGFHEDWQAMRMDELRAAAAKTGLDVAEHAALLYLRRDGQTIKVFAQRVDPATPTAMAALQAIETEQRGSRIVKIIGPTREEMIGGRPVARLDLVDEMSPPFYGTQFGFVERGYLIRFSMTTRDQAAIKDGFLPVMQTLTFY